MAADRPGDVVLPAAPVALARRGRRESPRRRGGALGAVCESRVQWADASTTGRCRCRARSALGQLSSGKAERGAEGPRLPHGAARRSARERCPSATKQPPPAWRSCAHSAAARQREHRSRDAGTECAVRVAARERRPSERRLAGAEQAERHRRAWWQRRFLRRHRDAAPVRPGHALRLGAPPRPRHFRLPRVGQDPARAAGAARAVSRRAGAQALRPGRRRALAGASAARRAALAALRSRQRRAAGAGGERRRRGAHGLRRRRPS